MLKMTVINHIGIKDFHQLKLIVFFEQNHLFTEFNVFII